MVVDQPMKVQMKTKFKPSPQQAGFYDWVSNGTGSCILEAVAGAGKTSTLIEGLGLMTGRIFFGAFNKKIADEIAHRAGLRNGLEVSTMHAAGMRAWKRVAARFMKVEANKCRDIFRAEVNRVNPYDAIFETPVLQLVSYAKQAAVGVISDIEERAVWMQLIEHFNVEVFDEVTGADNSKHIVQIAKHIFHLSAERCKDIIDFDDMIFAPLYFNVAFDKYDWVLIDECLVGDTPILIDFAGNTMTIKEMHETKYTGPVVSWSPEHGSVMSRVTGSKVTPVGKPMVRIRTKRHGYRKDGGRLAPLTEEVRYGIRTLVCTADHKIWTSRGWVPAGELKPGDIVKHETTAPLERHYQATYAHTKKGRAALAKKADFKRFGGYAPKKGAWGAKRGGNGHGLTKHEKILLERLGAGWKPNFIIATGGRGQGYPTHYKLDIANKDLMIAIEVDGCSHNNPRAKAADERKADWLTERGWKVVHLTNQEVLTLTDDLLNERIANCPVTAEVMEVEPWKNKKHTHVYDIEVADYHCYFAHGLLVHNCQDTNASRREMALRMVKPETGRLVAVGDPHQAIYGFTGADADALDLIGDAVNAVRLPLTTTFRCPKAVVAYAQQWVSHIHAAETAPEGIVRQSELAKLKEEVQVGDAVLCRFNAPLLKTVYSLIAAGIPARVEGREIGAGLKNLANRWKVKTIQALLDKLDEYYNREVKKLEAKENNKGIEALTDKVECLRVVINRVIAKGAITQPPQLAVIAEIDAIFGIDDKDNAKPCVILSSCHKSKGREWKRVFWLQTGPSPFAKQNWEQLQERNIMYVAATRAMNELVLIDCPKNVK